MPGNDLIEARARIVKDGQGKSLQAIGDQDLLNLADILKIPLHQVYLQSMEKGIVPLRYLRNMPSITLKEQITLHASRVAVVGSGGLGGHVTAGLCRLGIGVLHIFDPDVFDETNLNRQAFSAQNTLGKPKVEVIRECCRRINPAVQVTAHQIAVADQNQHPLFADVQVIVDALDTPGDRLTLAAIAGKCRLPLVHGTVAGFGGRVMVIHPRDGRMEMLYGGREEACSAELLLGTPILSPVLISSFQMKAVLNLLLGRHQSREGRMVFVDMEKPSLDLFEL
ncbi:MAG: ThiF family adenylyltransferase [Desulfobacterales bacterium]|nr:ThiF family adenylyltransferase [Desulfobacterales bacterium]